MKEIKTTVAVFFVLGLLVGTLCMRLYDQHEHQKNMNDFVNKMYLIERSNGEISLVYDKRK